jgi:hypothetical protein
MSNKNSLEAILSRYEDIGSRMPPIPNDGLVMETDGIVERPTPASEGEFYARVLTDGYLPTKTKE